MKTKIAISFLLLAFSGSLLIAQDTLMVAKGDINNFSIGVFSLSNGVGFQAGGNISTGYLAKENGDGFLSDRNSYDGFKASFNGSNGFNAENNVTGFFAFQNNFQGFISQENAFEGFLAIQNGSSGFAATGNSRGFHSSGNTNEGYSSQENLKNGYSAFNNGWHGYLANRNTLNGFTSYLNSSDGYYAEANSGTGFKCESSGAHAGYFVNNDSTNLPAVYIAHGNPDNTDLKFGGHGFISSEEHIYFDLDADQTATDASVFFRASDGSHIAVFSESGSSTISNGLDISGGDLNVTAGEVCATNVTCSSDIRFKKDIKSLSDCLTKIEKIRGVTYHWDTEQWKDRFDDRPQIGFIAQEIEQIFPQMVSTDDQGYKSVDYGKMSAVLLEAIKELIAGNEAIRQENARLSARLDEMQSYEERLTNLEAILKELK